MELKIAKRAFCLFGMGEIVAITNQKGGVGKTTTAINLSRALTLLRKSILLVDMDPQANCTSGFGFSHIEKSVYDVLLKGSMDGAILKRTRMPDFVPATTDLTGAEVELVNVENRNLRLKNALSAVGRNYDYVFIDCPPSLGILTLNALAAADSVLIPLQCEFYALEGLGKLLSTLKFVRDSLNESLYIKGVVVTMFDSRLNLTNQVAEEIRKFFGEKLFRTVIARNVRLAEAPSFGKDIFEYDGKSRGAANYISLAKEFLRRERI